MRTPSRPPPPVPLSEALWQAPQRILLGEPGPGKTTTFRFIVLCFATGMAGEGLNLAERRVPLRPLRPRREARQDNKTGPPGRVAP